MKKILETAQCLIFVDSFLDIAIMGTRRLKILTQTIN